MISIISELGSTRIRKLNNKIMSIPRMFFPEGLCFSFRIASAGATRGQPTDDPRNTPRTRGMLIAKDRRTAKMAQRLLPVQPIRTTMAVLESSADGGDHCRVTPTTNLQQKEVRSESEEKKRSTFFFSLLFLQSHRTFLCCKCRVFALSDAVAARCMLFVAESPNRCFG